MLGSASRLDPITAHYLFSASLGCSTICYFNLLPFYSKRKEKAITNLNNKQTSVLLKKVAISIVPQKLQSVNYFLRLFFFNLICLTTCCSLVLSCSLAVLLLVCVCLIVLSCSLLLVVLSVCACLFVSLTLSAYREAVASVRCLVLHLLHTLQCCSSLGQIAKARMLLVLVMFTPLQLCVLCSICAFVEAVALYLLQLA